MWIGNRFYIAIYMERLSKKISELYDFIQHIYTDEIFWLLQKYILWFVKTLKLQFIHTSPLLIPAYWSIYDIHLWYNIWSEIYKRRPCIVISWSKFNTWDTILIIPLSSFSEIKRILHDKHVILKSNHINNLENDSIVLLPQTRCISKRRIGKFRWHTDKETMHVIASKLWKIIQQ